MQQTKVRTIIKFGSRDVVGTQGHVEKYIERPDMSALNAFRRFKDGKSTNPFDDPLGIQVSNLMGIPNAWEKLCDRLGLPLAKLVKLAMTPETRDQIPVIEVIPTNNSFNVREKLCLPPRNSWLVKFALEKMNPEDRNAAVLEVVRSYYRYDFPGFDAIRLLAEIGLGDIETHGISATWEKSPHFRAGKGSAYKLQLADVPYVRVNESTNSDYYEEVRSYSDAMELLMFLQKQDMDAFATMVMVLLDASARPDFTRAQELLSRIRLCGEAYVIDPDARYSGHHELRVPLGISVNGTISEY